MTSSSCKGTTPPVQVPPEVPPEPAATPPGMAMLGTLPRGAPPGPPAPVLLAPWAAANLTSLMRIEESLLSPSVSLICLAKSCALEPPMEKARTRRVKSSSVTLLENRMLESPAAVSNWAKLRSACPASSGMPSRRSLLSETPSRKPVSPLLGSACWSSLQAVWNWPSVRLWLVPYSRVYLIKILRLWRNDRADALRPVSVCAVLAIAASCRYMERWQQD